MKSPFPAVTATARNLPAESRADSRSIRRESAPIKGTGGDSFRVVVLHNDAGTFLYDLTVTTLDEARASAAAKTKYNASAYILPGFEIYRIGIRLNPHYTAPPPQIAEPKKPMSSKARKKANLKAKINRAITNGWRPGRGPVGEFSRKSKKLTER